MEHSNKNEFLQKLEAKLAEIKGSIDNLKADMESAAEDQKAKINEKMEDLQEKHEEGTKRQKEFQEAPDVIWIGMQEDVEAFWKRLTEE